MGICAVTPCRSPHLWRDPDAFRPERFSEANANADFGGAWAGYRPEAQGSSLYPNEVASDFAFIPFGGGMRKCVGDQFALTEAAVALVLLLRCAASGLQGFRPSNRVWLSCRVMCRGFRACSGGGDVHVLQLRFAAA